MAGIGIGIKTNKSASLYWTPQIPTGLTATVDSDTAITLNWTNIDTKGDGVKVYMSSDGGANYSLKETLGIVTTKQITGLTSNSTYYFYVVSYKGSKESNPSNIINAYTWTTEYNTVYSSFTAKPISVASTAYNSFIRTLKAANIWSKLDLFYCFASHSNDNGEALINWVDPTKYNASVQNSSYFLFEKYKGIQGTGSAYLKTGFNPKLNSINATVNSASVGCNIWNHGAGSATAKHFGLVDGSGNYLFFSSATLWSINSTGYSFPGGNTDNKGNYILSRTASNSDPLYKNKVKTNSSNASSDFPNGELYILCWNNGGAAQGSVDELRWFFFGAGLNDSEEGIMSDALDQLGTDIDNVCALSYLRTQDAKHIEYINGLYQFGFNRTQVFFSSDGGATFTYQNFSQTNPYTIESAVVFSNGNIFWTYLDKCYRSIDGLTTYEEVKCKTINNEDYVPVNTDSVFRSIGAILINTINNKELCVWGNYITVVGGEVNVYRMYDDCIPKIIKANVQGIRHFHYVALDTINNIYYLTTGDGAPGTTIYKFTYDSGAETFTDTTVTPSILNTRYLAGITYESGYLFLQEDYDAGSGKMYKVPVADLADFTKWETLYTGVSTKQLFAIALNSNGVGISVGHYGYLITQNFFRTYEYFTVATGMKIIKTTANNFMFFDQNSNSTDLFQSNYMYVAPLAVPESVDN